MDKLATGMRRGIRSVALAASMTGMLIAQTAAAAEIAPLLGQITVNGGAAINGQAGVSGASIFSGDRIHTQRDSTAALSLVGGREVILVGAGSLSVTGDRGRIRVVIEAGKVAVLSLAEAPVEIEARGVGIMPGKAGGVYVIEVDGQTLHVTARKGFAEVDAANRTVEVTEGMKLEAILGSSQKLEGEGAPALRTPIVKFTLISAAVLSVAALTLAVIDLNASCRVSASSVGSCEVVH
ncbi:MAG TPA: hypothetical protein VGT03_05550 [Candidatus Acidoferrales bacterium]|nr:hypothetical protein [Candidatus Acidoferrales bacterium]